MTEDTKPGTADESVATSSSGRQRKKRKWDQPAENLLLAGAANPLVPLDMGVYGGITFPGIVPLSGSLLTQPVPSSAAQLMAPTLHHNAAAIVQKLIQPKIQDELVIAREIVINDAEPSIRYKLTKRQTQEEIQMCTGAVVITRGKYRLPNALPDNEKPLYLHISAGAHLQLKDTAERIKAVDRAAAMVEEIMKQPHTSQGVSTVSHAVTSSGQSLSMCIYLGFDCDPSANIADRIRGPNDQYVNHIMNETGATVVLRGHVSGNHDSSHPEDTLQPMHLYLSSTNPKSLEHARILAENLLDTIAVECGTSRKSSSRTYSAVPPPQQLLADAESLATSGSLTNVSSAGTAAKSFTLNGSLLPTSAVVCPGLPIQTGSVMSYSTNLVSCSAPPVPGGTSYDGYGGIYPQATPLQQVALALKQAPSTASVVSSTTCNATAALKTHSNSTIEADKGPRQRRKFQELPVASKGPTTLLEKSQQGSVLMQSSENRDRLDVSSMPPPKKLIESGPHLMHPPHPKNMLPPTPKFLAPKLPSASDSKNVVSGSGSSPPHYKIVPPPPPKFLSSELHPKVEGKPREMKKPTPEQVPDTLLKIMEYGDDDDDVDSIESQPNRSTTQKSVPKPFWAV